FQSNEIILIEDFNNALFYIYSFYSNILIHFFDLIILRFLFHIGKDKAVVDESTVIRLIAKISSISQKAFSRLFVVIIHGLIYPIPYGSPHEEVCRLDGLPIINEITCRITHGVRVFGNVKRIFNIEFSLYSSSHPADRRVLV